MSRPAILALSAALSAFVLVLAGAAAMYGRRSPPELSSKPAAQSVPVEVVRAREAEYRRLLDEAITRARTPESGAAAAPVAPDPEPSVVRARLERHDDGDDDEHRRHGGHERRTRSHEDDDDG